VKTQTYEVTFMIPSPLTVGIGIAILYLLGVWIYDRKTRDNRGWLFTSPRWWAWAWPLVLTTMLYILAYMRIADYLRRR